MKRLVVISSVIMLTLASCSKGSSSPPVPPAPDLFIVVSNSINGQPFQSPSYNINSTPVIKVSFSSKIDKGLVSGNVLLTAGTGTVAAYSVSYENSDSTMVIQPSPALNAISKYSLNVVTGLQSQQKAKLQSAVSFDFITALDSTDKFPRVSDSALLSLVQKQTFKYFWDFGHPVSGLARERNSSGDVVTIGGSGFGIMSIVTAVNRNFITRSQGLTKMQTIVSFLKNTAQKFHGAFPHWMNGISGVVVPFSQKDDGADLVETSYLMQGLLCARQYFNTADPAETTLRTDINTLWDGVEWSWFRQNNQDVLYWHWSPTYNWDMNFPIHGWDEALITYVMAASSNTYSIPKSVYDNGWAGTPGFINNNTYFGFQLPLGPALGGPLFFAHYSFLGINPNSLTDAYADYAKQTKNHALINYNYCVSNPKGYYGYSNASWGLTASDIPNGYNANSPTNDIGVITPTAALSSFPYTPTESMMALKFFYYTMGDKLWGDYGFYDAYDLKDTWFANSTLAIDQGPVIVMIENYRSGLLWNLFMSCPEVKTGMHNLGFVSPYL